MVWSVWPPTTEQPSVVELDAHWSCHPLGHATNSRAASTYTPMSVHDRERSVTPSLRASCAHPQQDRRYLGTAAWHIERRRPVHQRAAVLCCLTWERDVHAHPIPLRGLPLGSAPRPGRSRVRCLRCCTSRTRVQHGTFKVAWRLAAFCLMAPRRSGVCTHAARGSSGTVCSGVYTRTKSVRCSVPPSSHADGVHLTLACRSNRLQRVRHIVRVYGMHRRRQPPST